VKEIPVEVKNLSKLVGNTPLLELSVQLRGKKLKIYAKYEAWNYSGSIKDRMALQILRSAYSCGALESKDSIIEATSGNTGIAFAAMGAFLGHSVEIYMPDWLSEERKQLLRFYGAKLHEISADEGGFLHCIGLAEQKSQKKGFFCPKQFENSNNPLAHFVSTAPEMELGLMKAGLGDIDAFVAGVGTGGTIMGFFRYFEEKIKHFQAFPVFPVNNSDGAHRIEGIGDSFVPKILSMEELGPDIRISDSDAISVARMMNKRGLSVGISSGANLLAATMKCLELGEDKIIGTIICDDNKKYLSTDLCSDSVEELSCDFKFLSYRKIG
jgi:cysteine synthase A